MRKDILREAADYLTGRRSKRIWKKVVGALACVVVFCTVYALILPAITLERTPQCDKEEHVHSEDCYATAAAGSERSLICTPESLGLHRHTDACLDENGAYRCGEADFVVHEHNADCLDESGALRCPLPEVKAHTHDESCYAPAEEELPHAHTDECYALERGGLMCAVPEGEGAHTHSAEAGCYDESGALACQLEESSGHQHTDDCYAWETVLICDQPADLAEPEEPAAPVLICGKEEVILHTHTPEECFETDGEGNTRLICGKTQILEHVHTDACFQTVEEPADAGTLSCGLEEHTHSAACGVIGMIGELPTRQSIEERAAAFLENGDEAGREAYLTGLQTQVREASAAYAALPEEEQAKVTNLSRLTELEWLQGLSLDGAEAAAATVVNNDGTNATVTPWADGTGAAQKHLKAALLTVGQGYTIEEAAFYKIQGLSTGTAKVTYTGGGLKAADTGAKVFVYALGTDGMAEPQSCAVTDPVRDDATDLFTEFSFEESQGSGEAARVYAFISARPATLEEMGIYLGEKQADGTWVAYDAKTEADANVKVTIDLNGKEAPVGYAPFIRKIEEGEGFYPKDEEIVAEAGKVNGWQCYTIRWIKQDKDGLHMEPLSKKGPVTVTIKYLKDEARLPGPPGARKLLIYNSDMDGSLVTQVADTVENVWVDGDSYTEFTFRAADAGPYVFVSKNLTTCYVDGLSIEGMLDGSAPFDSSDTPGNDSNDHNKIVRSYDTIQYTIGATFAARQDGVTEKTVNLYFELILNKSATAARFDTSKMLWVGENYSVEYLDANDKVIMVMAHDGKYYRPMEKNGETVRDEHGFALPDKSRGTVSMNAQLAGSRAGRDSYKVSSGGVVKQRLVGWTVLTANEGESILSGNQKFPAAVQVRNADNGETFAPVFRLWLEGNEENYGPETKTGDALLPAQPDEENILDLSKYKDGQYQVKVSAGTNFNVQLLKNGDMSYKNWFDFVNGTAVSGETRAELERLANLEENHGKSNPAEFTDGGKPLSPETQKEYANYRYGRITCYGITLQLYNDTDNNPGANRAAKGLRGLSLPVGDITFDLNFWSTVKSEDTEHLKPNEYTAILWDYNENIPAYEEYKGNYADPGRTGEITLSDGLGLGNGRRRIYWDGEIRSAYAKGAAPSNYKVYHTGCYYGGDWALTDASGNPVTDIYSIANPTKVTGSGEGTTYHFSVRDYDFDFDNQKFPTQNAGDSNQVAVYGTYARCFSAGCVQVLSVFPRVQEVGEAEVFLNTKVSNLRLVTRAEQTLAPQEGDKGGYNHEVNKDDNETRDQIVLYAPGNLTKGSAFNGLSKGEVPEATNQGYLGTDYWTTSYDCSTFAGDDIWIMSYGMISSGADYRMRSMNLLQLFDSKALSIRGEPTLYWNIDETVDKPGTATFLYAADPDYPEGYDTNHKDASGKYDVLEYMNGVREEDLIYFTSLEELEKAGYTCVGVLMELRGCDILGGKYQYMSVPVKVNENDPDLVSKTVATVNTFRVWSWDQVDASDQPISWKNGEWNATTGKNELEGFHKPTNSIGVDDRYSGELANGGGKLANGNYGPVKYTKTEYDENNLQVEGTHAGGTPAGNSLLILGYKAGINIGVNNKDASAGLVSYNIGEGETVVDYCLKNIRTEISDRTGQTQSPTTKLTIKTVLDEGYTGEQRISVAGGTYRIEGYAVDASGKVDSSKTSIAIGTDPSHPTVLEFDGSDGKRHRIRVYAVMGENGQSIEFVIQDAPVGLHLPDITFQANFAAVTALKDNDNIKTSTYISGTSDKRAYDQTKGNTDNVTVGVVLRSGTNLTKAVDTRYIELDGTITYSVTYNNSGTEPIPKIYFYDLLPREGDIRGSSFEGEVIVRSVGASSKQGNGEGKATATIYYSERDYRTLYEKVSKFGEGATPEERVDDIERMLQDGDWFKVLATVKDGQLIYSEEFKILTPEQKTERMSKITGLYAMVEKLEKGEAVTLSVTVETKGNKADDWYKNIANSWIAGTGMLPLTSNKVETQVVSRRISGIVWFDKNLNGVRDEGEPLLEGVTATLFRKDTSGYVECVEDVRGKTITPVTTGDDGAYAFENLPAGEYVVVFSGTALEKFTGATDYQRNGRNDANTNDGKAVPDGTSQTYAYYVHYSDQDPVLTLHSIGAMGSVKLNNGVEEYANQDLGLIMAGKKLPDTGGPGTALYTLLGLVLMAGALLCLRRRRGI